MQNDNPQPRRSRVPGDLNRNVYVTPAGTFEVGYKDGRGTQRWKSVGNSILEARRVRDDLLARRAKGEPTTSNVRLRFGAAADAWESGHVATLGERTQETYRAHLKRLRDRFATARLDRIGPDGFAEFVREARTRGLAEWTIQGMLSVANQIYRFADRRLGWAGRNPIPRLTPSERARTSEAKRKVIFTEDQISQTLAAAQEPFKTLFTVAARTGARVSEICGLTWADLTVDDLDDAEIRFLFQVARDGVTRTAPKTTGSGRVVPIDRELAEILVTYQHVRALDGYRVGPDNFVFCTRTDKAINQRNVGRALRDTQKAAVRPGGKPTFPVLHALDADENPIPAPSGVLPSMHSFRHSYVSYALHHGADLWDVAREVGHASTAVTEQIYWHEINDAKRKAAKRARMAKRAREAAGQSPTEVTR